MLMYADVSVKARLKVLFETLNFQKVINSKRHTSFNEQSY